VSVCFCCRSNIDKLKDSGRVNGVVLVPFNDSTTPDEFSPDSSCPNDRFGKRSSTSFLHLHNRNKHCCVSLNKPCCVCLNKPCCVSLNKPCCVCLNKPCCVCLNKPCCVCLNKPCCVCLNKPCCVSLNEPCCVSLNKPC